MAKPIMDVRYIQVIRAKDGVQQKLTPMEIISLAKEIGAIAAQNVQNKIDFWEGWTDKKIWNKNTAWNLNYSVAFSFFH